MLFRGEVFICSLDTFIVPGGPQQRPHYSEFLQGGCEESLAQREASKDLRLDDARMKPIDAAEFFMVSEMSLWRWRMLKYQDESRRAMTKKNAC